MSALSFNFGEVINIFRSGGYTEVINSKIQVFVDVESYVEEGHW